MTHKPIAMAAVLAAVPGRGGASGAPRDGGLSDDGSDATTGADGSIATDASHDTSLGLPDGASYGCPPPSDAAVIDASAASTWGLPPDGGQWSPFCPETVPVAGTSCPNAARGFYCEYGSAWWSVGCDTVMYCYTQSGIWGNYNPSPDCLPEPGPNCAACPFDPSGLQGSCSSPDLVCHYGQGPTCLCSPQVGNQWLCSPPSGCPSVRPRLGAGCADGPSGGCSYNCNDAFLCVNPGVWSPGGPLQN